MLTRNQIKKNLSVMTSYELERYYIVLEKNKKMGVTHLESMKENALQMALVLELLKQYNS